MNQSDAGEKYAALRDRRILVVEDEFMLADDLAVGFTEAGATVVGPVPTVEEALALAQSEERLDAAVLDVNLGEQMVFPVVDALEGRGVPLVFVTGYDPESLPERFANAVICKKPVSFAAIARAVGKVLQS